MLVAASLLALTAAAGLGAAPGGGRVQATLTPRPAALELGRAWQATIRLRRDGKPYGAVRPVLTARKGSVPINMVAASNGDVFVVTGDRIRKVTASGGTITSTPTAST